MVIVGTVRSRSVASSTPTIAPPISPKHRHLQLQFLLLQTALARSSLTGISFVTDRTCSVAHPAPIGCVALTNCRLCRATKNKDNQFLINCAVIQETNPGSARRLCTADNAEDPMPRNFTTIALSCVGGMALVVAIIGLAHSKFCRRDNTVLLMRLA
ncbi:hypothetical protein Pcac1_g23683 [Phytophthora cactorum]|nr:hypothetical protein Pcac1_g23683 [Phytophthora cactorum]